MNTKTICAITMLVCIIVCVVMIFKLFEYTGVSMGFNIPTVVLLTPIVVMISVLIAICRMK